MNILYINHGIKDINLKRFRKCEEVMKTLPNPKDPPMITYKYTRPIRGKLFKYKDTS